MAYKHTLASRYSFGWQNSETSLADHGDTGTVLSFDGGAAGDTLSLSGALTASGALTVGGGSAVAAISTGTASVSFGAIAALGTSSLKTVALSGATRGDLILVTPDSIFPNVTDNQLVTIFASSSSTAGEVNVWAANSAQSAITPTANTVLRLVRFNFASYI